MYVWIVMDLRVSSTSTGGACGAEVLASSCVFSVTAMGSKRPSEAGATKMS